MLLAVPSQRTRLRGWRVVGWDVLVQDGDGSRLGLPAQLQSRFRMPKCGRTYACSRTNVHLGRLQEAGAKVQPTNNTFHFNTI